MGTDLSAVRQVVGLDVGHGQIAAAEAGVGPTSKPADLELFGRKVQISALARDSNGEVVIGLSALKQRSVEQLEVAFKRRPNADPAYRKVMTDFVKAIHRHLTTETAQVGTKGAYHYFVGCPSGWKEDTEIPAYEALLREAGIPGLTVVKESHAALIHAKSSDDSLLIPQIKGPIVVIDIGSSTTDFTFSKDRRSDSVSDGLDLGGAMIDEGILDEMLAVQANRSELLAEIGASRVARNKCLLECRKAKEAYFSEPHLYQDQPCEESVKLQRGRFEIELTAATMKKVLARPVVQLGNRTWEQAFRDAAAKFKRERVDPSRVTTGVVLATGGAAKMGFVKAACEAAFPGWVFWRGSEPELAISRGLALYARVDIMVKGFLRDIEQGVVAQVPKVVEGALPALIDKLVDEYTDEIVTEVIKQGLKDWRAGKVKALSDLDSHMKKLARKWAESDSPKEILTKAAKEWVKGVEKTIHEAGRSICTKYGLDPGILRLQDVAYKGISDTPNVPAVSDPTTIDDVTAAVLAAVVVAIIGVTIASVTVTAGIGTIAILVAIAAAGGINNWAKNGDLPLWARKQVLSDEQISDKVKEHKPDVRSKVRAAIDGDSDFKKQFSDKIVTALRAGIHARAEEARLLIK